MTKAAALRTGRSVYGNGTLTMSQTSKIGVGAGIGLDDHSLKVERIVDRAAPALVKTTQLHRFVDKFVAFRQPQRGCALAADRRLRLLLNLLVIIVSM